MTRMLGGRGGYGGITTMNQEQRLGRYYPHIAVYKQTDPLTRLVHVRCYKCNQTWQHPEGSPGKPEECNG